MLKLTKTIIAVILLFANSALFASTPNYMIVVDAGSSGSRLHLFQYENDKKLPVIRDIFSESTSVALSTFTKNPDNVLQSFKTLLDHAKEKLVVAHADLHVVSISILGTAGMRLLPADEANTTYQRLTAYLQNNYPFAISKIATLPEKLEGAYGWLDVNYLAHHF